MPDGKRLALLLESLRSHDISFDEKDLQEAFDSQGELAVEIWIDEHLRSETLLTKEELSLYSALQKSGESEALALSQDLSLIRGLTDNDIQSAIEQLRNSSIAIEKHTETLHTQQEVADSLVKANGRNNSTRAAADSTQFMEWTTEYNQTRFAVDELLTNLKYQIAELAGLCKSADVELRKNASEILRLDDKLLLGLQTLANDLDPGYQEADGTTNRIRDLCARLIKCTVEGVRTRLDRIYLEAMSGSEDAPRRTRATENVEIVALLDELESLYTEILSVAQISAEQQYLEPALRLITSHTIQGGDRSSKIIEYISKCLSDLMNKLQDFTIHTEDYKSYRAATMLMASAIKSELDADRPPSPKARQPNSPTRLRKQSKPISPVRPRNTRRRSSATSFDDDVNPELQVLRNLGISLPNEPTSERYIAAALQDILMDRAMKLNGHTKSLQEVSEASIGSHLHDTRVTLQLLMQSLLSATEYNSVSLFDKEVLEAVDKLEKGVAGVRRETGVVKLDSLRERNVRREDLVERWAR